MKVGDLVRSTRSGCLGLIVSVELNPWCVIIRWVDNGEEDDYDYDIRDWFEVISENR